MAISFVGSTAGNSKLATTSSASFTNLRNSAGVAPTLLAGDIIIVTIVHSSATGTSRTLAQLTPTIGSGGANNGTAYNAINAAAIVAPTAETNVASMAVFYTPYVSGMSAVNIPACALTTNSISFVIEVWRGVDPTDPFGGVAPTTATGQNTGLANPPAITIPVDLAGAVVKGAFGSAVASAAVYTNTGATPYDTTTNVFKSTLENSSTNRSVAGVGAKTGLAAGATFDAAITGSNTTNTGSWAATAFILNPATPARKPYSYAFMI